MSTATAASLRVRAWSSIRPARSSCTRLGSAEAGSSAPPGAPPSPAARRAASASGSGSALCGAYASGSARSATAARSTRMASRTPGFRRRPPFAPPAAAAPSAAPSSRLMRARTSLARLRSSARASALADDPPPIANSTLGLTFMTGKGRSGQECPEKRSGLRVVRSGARAKSAPLPAEARVESD